MATGKLLGKRREKEATLRNGNHLLA